MQLHPFLFAFRYLFLSKLLRIYCKFNNNFEQETLYFKTLPGIINYGMVYLLTVLLKHPELKALVQLVLLDGPELEELLLARVDLVQELHDQGDAALQVGVKGHVARRAVAPAVAAVVAVAGLAA